MRCPGMTLMRMPLFCWTALCTIILMIFAMPPLTVATALLALDRYLGFHFFTNDLGGNMMNYANLFWLFGHPEVYILILPAFGVYSEVISAFSSKELYGYVSLVLATMAIAVLSFTVWVHHFFTMGQSADINAVFGIATMTIGVPTGVKIYDWIWTMFRGEVRFTPPMLFSIAFMMTFVLGGFTGIILAIPPLDYLVHNTLFLVAHFHNMLIPGLLYGMLAGYQYWFPKAFGFRLNERWGRDLLRLLGGRLLPRLHAALRARRCRHGAADAGVVRTRFPALARCRAVRRVPPFRRARDACSCSSGSASASATPTACSSAIRGMRAGLEWSISAPPPEYNFATIPHVSRRDAFYWRKANHGAYKPADHYRDIETAEGTAWWGRSSASPARSAPSAWSGTSGGWRSSVSWPSGRR